VIFKCFILWTFFVFRFFGLFITATNKSLFYVTLYQQGDNWTTSTLCPKMSTFLFVKNNFVKINRFLIVFGVLNPEKIWHQQLVHLPISPYSVATLPWEIRKVVFQEYYSYILQIIYVISEENKLLFPHPPHLKNVTTLPCKMQNFFIWLKVMLRSTMLCWN